MCRFLYILLGICLTTQMCSNVLGKLHRRSNGTSIGYEQLYPAKIGKIKTALGGTPPDRIIVLGIFPNTGSPFSIEYCTRNCRVHFGEIVLKNKTRYPLAVPKVKRDGILCGCSLNPLHVKHYITRRKHRFEEFTHLATASFCKARVWMAQNNMSLEIPYEVEANKQKSSQSESVSGSANNPAGDKKQVRFAVPEKGKDGENTATSSKAKEYPEVILGAFRSTGPHFTTESCGVNCKTAFGTVALEPGVQTLLAQPVLLASDKKICSCRLNAKPIQDWAKAQNIDYEDVLNKAEQSYCALNDWFDNQFIDVTIQYEVNAHPERDADRPKEILFGKLDKKLISRTNHTLEDCTPTCNKKFGWLVIYPTNPPTLLPFSETKVSANGKACECYLNMRPIEEYFIERQNSGPAWKFDNFLQWCKKSYNDGKKHLEGLNIKVVYDDGSKKTTPKG